MVAEDRGGSQVEDLLDRDGGSQEVPRSTKSALAHVIWDRVVARFETS